MTLEKGKPGESRGRKAASLKSVKAMIVGLPSISAPYDLEHAARGGGIMSRKAALLFISFFLLICVGANAVSAAENIKVFNCEESRMELFVDSKDKVMLAKEWYEYEFEISTVNSIGALEMKAVDSQSYLEALQEVEFPVAAVGSYKIYFLDYKLKDYFSALALSFKDGSVVVFGNYYDLSQDKIHQLAVHELGHQVDFCLMDEEKRHEYKRLRGLENQEKFNDYTQEYKNRVQEIFAEDFRILFGGEKAKKAAHLNGDLINPAQVPGLREFFLSLL